MALEMRKLLFGILFLTLNLASFGQQNTDELHKRFLQYLQIKKVDSIYNSSLKQDKNDEETLLYRNHFGWALNKTEQLKKDIPAILELPSHSMEMAYERIFRPQKFPPSE